MDILSLWLGIIFGVIGLAGTVYTYLSYRSSRQNERIYNYLFTLAEKNIDKNVTEQELSQRKGELQKATERVAALQEQIRRDIPREAKRAVLRDRFESYIEVIGREYEAMRLLQKELEALGEAPKLPAELARGIQAEIQPDYLLREKRARLQNYLSFLTASAAIVSALLPYPLDRYATLGFLVLAVPVLVALGKNMLRHVRKVSSPQQWVWLGVVAGAAMSGTAFVVALCFSILAVVEPRSVIISIPIVIISAAFGVFAALKSHRRFKTLSKVGPTKGAADSTDQSREAGSVAS